MKIGYENISVVIGSRKERVEAHLSIPIPTDGGDWCCVITLNGVSTGGRYRSFGVDGIQAAKLAIRHLDELILASDEYANRQLFLSSQDEENWEILDESFFEL